MLRHEIRLRTLIFNYFLKYFTPQEVREILQDMITYFNSPHAMNVYNLIHNNN